MQQREREREREKKERKKKRKKKQNNDQKRAEKEQLLTSTFCDTLFIFFFSKRRGRFDLHNNAHKTQKTRAREKESVRRQNHHTFLHRNESLFEEEDGKRRFVGGAILKHS